MARLSDVQYLSTQTSTGKMWSAYISCFGGAQWLQDSGRFVSLDNKDPAEKTDYFRTKPLAVAAALLALGE